jgi:hypothetical protein
MNYYVKGIWINYVPLSFLFCNLLDYNKVSFVSVCERLACLVW